MEAWNGDLILTNGHLITDIHIGAPNTTWSIPPQTTQLRFLAFVDPSRIPLHLIHGSRLDVWTTKSETESWFSDTLLREEVDEDEAEWWHTARPESPLGVLVAVDYIKTTPTRQPRITEILFFASRTDASSSSCSPPTPPQSSNPNPSDSPTFTIHALTLSSDLVAHADDATHTISPPVNSTDPIEATFLPEPTIQSSKPTTINPLKRKSIHDTFSEADSLRKRIRSKPGESVQAASYSTPSMPSLKQMTSSALESRSSGSRPPSASGASIPMQTRPLSRSSSISSVRGASMGRPPTSTEPSKPSGLAQMQRATTTTTEHPPGGIDDKEVEQKNKDTLSRLVMAGMRLYGLSQSKAKKNARRASMAPNSNIAQAALLARSESPSLPQKASSPIPNTEEMDEEEEENRRQKDEEYRYIYHQAYKGACFAFRSRIAKENFQPHIETLREVVDKLLVMFCVDPFAAGLPGVVEAKVTPGGRRIFDTPGEEEKSGRLILDKA